MKKVLYTLALLGGLATGCKSGDSDPGPTAPTGPGLLDNGSVKVSLVATTVPANTEDVCFTNELPGPSATPAQWLGSRCTK